MDLSSDIVFSLIRSSEQFPVDFEDAWQWIGYTRKNNAKSSLLTSGFVDGTDFRILLNSQQNSKVGRKSERIELTVDCFKSFCMMAGTAKGKEVRAYFLECEKELKRLISEEKNLRKERVLKAVINESHTIWEKRFEDDFFEEAYRITGWKKPKKGHPPCMGQLINETIYSPPWVALGQNFDRVTEFCKGINNTDTLCFLHSHRDPEICISPSFG